MLWPQTLISTDDLNRLAILPATFIQWWAGGRFYRAAWRAARHRTTNMDTLVVAGTSAAWAYSVVLTAWPSIATDAGRDPQTYFDSSTLIIGLVLLGRWLEARAKGQATGAIRRLIGLQATSARVVVGGYTDDVGAAKDNLRLSQARANSVVVFLTRHGVNSKVLVAKGYGEAKPIAPV